MIVKWHNISIICKETPVAHLSVVVAQMPSQNLLFQSPF